MYTAEVPRQNARAATGDPFNAPVMTGKQNSQLFQCQRYSVQRRSVLHVKPRCQAGATPFFVSANIHDCLPQVPRDAFQKMSEKITYVQPWQLNVPRGFSKSLSYCASVEDLYICAADLSGRVLEGVVTFLLHLLEGGQSGRGRGKKVL